MTIHAYNPSQPSEGGGGKTLNYIYSLGSVWIVGDPVSKRPSHYTVQFSLGWGEGWGCSWNTPSDANARASATHSANTRQERVGVNKHPSQVDLIPDLTPLSLIAAQPGPR